MSPLRSVAAAGAIFVGTLNGSRSFRILTSVSRGPHAECRQPRTSRPLVADFSNRVGAYELTMVADSGPRRGMSTIGRLTLFTFRDSVMNGRLSREFPLRGQADIHLDDVGAAASGNPAAASAPWFGVLVMQLRPGDRDNLEGWFGTRLYLGMLPETDLTFTALDVSELLPSGFSGHWFTFGPRRLHKSAGHFCAERLPA